MNYLEELDNREFGNAQEFIIRERKKEIFVLDSSVIFKWFYSDNEKGTDIAGDLYKKAASRDYYFLSPELLIYELVNIFRFRANLSEKLLKNILEQIFSILVFLKLDCESYIKSYSISRKINCSIYDCIYISMSDKYKAPLITADKKLHKNATENNLNVMLLDEFAGI